MPSKKQALITITYFMKIGIIGGSGLEDANLLENIEEIDVNTRYGKPSSVIKKGGLNELDVYVISRHGLEHDITPTSVNNKANIFALHELGCRRIFSTTAVGSLKEEIRPGDFVIPDQFIDQTRHRDITFYEDFKEKVMHTSLADPFSESLRQVLINSCEKLGLRHSTKGTVVTIEGPRFNTRAESNMYRQFADVVNMSTAPEAILAREVALEYAVIAMSTDYDCWKESEKAVTWKEIEEIMAKNSESVKEVLKYSLEQLSEERPLKSDLDYIRDHIRAVPNHPKPGIMFRDITTLLQDGKGMKKVVDILHERYKDKNVDVVAGIESRGFVIGGSLADRLGVGFVLIRKKGKLPSEKISAEYKLEYGTDEVEMHTDAIKRGERVVLFDDLIATGGTAEAACNLIEKLGGDIVECSFIVGLPDLKGKEKISRYPIYSLVEFEGE